MQHDEPIDAVRGNKNVFADNLQCRPFVPERGWLRIESRETRIVPGEANVVCQRIEPDVSDEVLIEWQLDSPIEPRFRARDAEVRTGLAVVADFFNRIAQFGLPKIGNDCVFSIIEISNQPFFVVT